VDQRRQGNYKEKKKKNKYNILDGKLHVKRPLGKPTHRWKKS
jgi:hypothetical protein